MAIVLAIAAISAGWALRKHFKLRKNLLYDVISSTPIVSVDQEKETPIKVYYDGMQVTNVYTTIIKITNIGSPLPSGDYESPLTIYMGPDARIFSIEVREKFPSDLEVSCTIQEKIFNIEPLLLNTGDFFSIKVVGTNFGEEISAKARIIGVRKIMNATGQYTSRDKRLMYTAFTGLGITFAGGILSSLFESSLPLLIVAIGGIIMITATTLGIYYEQKRKSSVTPKKDR